jgi:hypothetical protein
MNYQDMVRQLMAMMQQRQQAPAAGGTAPAAPSMLEDFEMPERPQPWQRPVAQYGGPHGTFEDRNRSARQQFYAPMQSRAAMPKGRFFN